MDSKDATNTMENKTEEVRTAKKRRRLYEPLTEETGKEPVSTIPPSVESKNQTADAIVKKYTIAASCTSLIPIPLADMLIGAGIQLFMVKELSRHYKIAFSTQKAKSLLAALIGGLNISLLSGSMLKVIPIVGLTAAVASNAVISGAITYAVGKVFIQHFETGGTLLDFNPSTMKAYFRKEFEKGKSVIPEGEK